ncbi:hypothetical protein ASPSYDRAFT_41787, partial [Aspergillus sydowii CBS 593.65]
MISALGQRMYEWVYCYCVLPAGSLLAASRRADNRNSVATVSPGAATEKVPKTGALCAVLWGCPDSSDLKEAPCGRTALPIQTETGPDPEMSRDQRPSRVEAGNQENQRQVAIMFRYVYLYVVFITFNTCLLTGLGP